MSEDDDVLNVDDLVAGKAAEQLGHGVIPTSAILIVETMSDEGTGIRFVRSTGQSTWLALGMLRSTQMAIESADLAAWDGLEP